MFLARLFDTRRRQGLQGEPLTERLGAKGRPTDRESVTDVSPRQPKPKGSLFIPLRGLFAGVPWRPEQNLEKAFLVHESERELVVHLWRIIEKAPSENHSKASEERTPACRSDIFTPYAKRRDVSHGFQMLDDVEVQDRLSRMVSRTLNVDLSSLVKEPSTVDDWIDHCLCALREKKAEEESLLAMQVATELIGEAQVATETPSHVNYLEFWVRLLASVEDDREIENAKHHRLALVQHWKHEVVPALEQLQSLCFAADYCRVLRASLEALRDAQTALAHQDPPGCVQPLKTLLDVFHMSNALVRLTGETRRLVFEKLAFVLDVCTLYFLRLFQTSLDELKWGSADGLSSERCADSVLQEFVHRYEALNLFQELYGFLTSGSTSFQWTSYAMAAVIIIRFRLLFCRSTSPLSRLDIPTEATHHVIAVLESHGHFLETHLSSDADRNALRVRSEVASLVAAELGRYVADVYHKLEKEDFRISDENDDATATRAFVTRAALQQRQEDLFDELIVTARRLAAIAPPSEQHNPSSCLFRSTSLPPPPSSCHVKTSLPTESGSVTPRSAHHTSDNGFHQTSSLSIVTSCPPPPTSLAPPVSQDSFDILCLLDQQRLLNYFKRREVDLMKPCSLLRNTEHRSSSPYAMSLSPSQFAPYATRVFRLSQALRDMIDAVQVFERRASVLTGPLAATYAQSVYRPVFLSARLALREAWNQFDSLTDHIAGCGLIIDSYHVGYEFLMSPLFSGKSGLEEETSEWNRLRNVTLRTLATSLVEELQDELALIYSRSPQDFLERCPQRIRDAARAAFLNLVGEILMEETIKFVDLRLNVLYREQRETLIKNCSQLLTLWETLPEFVPSPSLQTLCMRLQDIHRLFDVSETNVKQPLATMMALLRKRKQLTQILTATTRDAGATSAHVPGFLSVQLVREAETLLKKTQQFLQGTQHRQFPVENLHASSALQAIDDELDDLVHHKLNVVMFNASQCCEILRKRREFCFSTDIGEL